MAKNIAESDLSVGQLFTQLEKQADIMKEVDRLRSLILDIQKDYQERIVELQMSIRALEIITLSKD
jgi:hypothetical protein